MKIASLARVKIQDLTPYQSARRIGGSGDVWLNANESPESEDYQLSDQELHRYPEFQPEDLIANYAAYCGLQPEQILASRGADEAIELLIRAFCEPGIDSITISTPTYGMYQVSADTIGVDVCDIPLDSQFNPDYSQLAKSKSKLIFLCAPNNPTGGLIDQAALKNLLSQQSQALVIVDEAYIEFCPEQTVLGLLSEHPNLVITRTLSKAFALAGLRCGFTLANPETIAVLCKVIAPYPISRPVAEIATKALSETGLQVMQQRVAELNQRRTEALESLKNHKLVTEIFPATGNYILVRFEDASMVFKTLGQQGIVLRDFSNKPRLENCLRISIGNQQEMDRTLAALKTLESLYEPS